VIDRYTNGSRWEEQDSNLRRQSRLIYSQVPLATRKSSHDGSGGTRTRNFQVKSPLLLPVELQTQIIWINIRLSRFWSLNHLYRIPPFGLWKGTGGHLANCHKQQKRGGNFWFLSPSYLLFMDYILHMSFHIRKQGSTLNMPIAAIEITKLFCGHWVGHCF
jgi:hypothetical protein